MPKWCYLCFLALFGVEVKVLCIVELCFIVLLSDPRPRQCEKRECMARKNTLRINTPKIGNIVQLNRSIAL